ncbi:hypothetical protein [Novosphingobium ginsenosidimutans]|jgi:hypothetical protein|uniref:Uncharacterized protein n=1 Tax=Novosphingobium ginsenosidimutans TaxID=1176536 RepID=A0A5B8S319_9SPHN|nr:hypothetical protein [Novosphingobium ginsenosidimutans]QEA15127.1 hypothetical protein FRF71_02675 [Novosphingobium ginsenosidimutans]
MSKPELTPKMIEDLREDMLRRIRDIDENAMVRISIGRPIAEDLGHFSDWHDKWRDKDGGWSDGFGRSPP